MRDFIIRFISILLFFVILSVILVLAVGPTIGLFFLSKYIGAWFYVLLPVTIAFGIAVVWSTIIYFAKRNDNLEWKK